MTDGELDVLIEKHLFDWNLEHPGFYWQEGSTEDGTDGWDGWACPRCDLFVDGPDAEPDEPCARRYSTDPAACALVLDEIERRGWSYVIRFYPAEEYEVSIRYPEKGAIQVYEICTDTRYRAVCLAALAACEVTE